MRKLLVWMALAALPPVWAEDKPADLKPLQVACDVQVDVLKAKTAVLEARLQSLTAYVELLKTEQGQQYAYFEAQGNQLLSPLQAAINKAQQACAEGAKFDLATLECKTPEPKTPEPKTPDPKTQSDPAPSAP